MLPFFTSKNNNNFMYFPYVFIVDGVKCEDVWAETCQSYNGETKFEIGQSYWYLWDDVQV